MIVLRCTNENGVTADLDLFQGDELTLDISAIEVGEIGDVFGVSSQAFALPGTDNNNQFFGNLFDLGTTPATSFTKTVPCQVLYNGSEVFSGQLYIENVVTNQKGNTIYNVIVVNEVVDFKLLINELVMQDLSWSEYNHALTMTAVTSSWTGDLFSGDILYPLVNYGVNPDDLQSPYIEAGGNRRQFDNSSTPLRDVDFRPAIKAKAVIDKIFDAVNYTYTSSFFDTPYFDNLYILSTQQESGNQFASPVTESLDARVGSTQNLTNNTPTYINFATEIFDNSGAWSTNEYTAPVAGDYSFYAQLDFGTITGTRSPVSEALVLEWVDPTGVTVLANTYIDIATTTNPSVYIGTTILNLSAGDKVRLRARVATPPTVSATYPIVTGKILVSGVTTFIAGQVDISKIWRDNTKVLDVLTGLINKFNLVFEPIIGERNTIRIEPFNDWVDAGEIVDWTDKVDRSVKWEITHPLQSQPHELNFTDIPDTDALNKYTTDKFKKTYGSYTYTSDSDLASGEKTIGSYFSPMPVKGISGAPLMIVPTLAQQNTGEPLSSYLYNPRLAYYVGLVSGSTALEGYNDSTNVYARGNYWLRNDAGIPITASHYPLVHHLELEVDSNGVLQGADVSTTRDLHFGNILSPGHWSYHQPQYNAKTKRDAFYEYWSFYVNEIYDVDTRQVTLNIKLKPAEIQDIKLNSKIFIDGHYYRIDKITGADLTKDASVPVKLLKTLPRKLRFPRRRILSINGTLDQDLTVDDGSISANGTVNYIDYETGGIVTGTNVAKIANKDGLVTYNGGTKTIWNNNSPVNYTLVSQNNFGNNLVEESSNKINVTGENNVLKAKTSNVTVVGINNEVREYTAYSTVTGTNNILDVGSTNVQVFGNNQSIVSGSTDSVILGGSDNIINSSSLVAMVGGAANEIKNSPISRNVVVGGLNSTLSSSIDTVVINSDGNTHTSFTGNTLIGDFQSSDAAITGSDYRFNNTLVNGLYLEEEYYTNRHSYSVIAYSGSTNYAYSGDGLYKYIYEVDFDTAPSGSGIGTIELPTIASQDQIGRTILFKANNNINSGSRVDIVSYLDTDNIEGTRSYRLERPGQWVELRASQYNQSDSFITEWRVIRAGIPFESSTTNEGAYGSFYSTQTQAIAASGSAQLVTLNNTFTSNLLALSGSGAIEMDYRGSYSFTYTARVQNADNVIHYADFWIKYNGTDYPNSTVRVTIPARKNATDFFKQPVTVQLLDVAVNNGDKIELYWRGDSTLLSLQYETFGGVVPNAPSVRTTIHAV